MRGSTLIGHRLPDGEAVHLPLLSRMQGMYVIGMAGMGKTTLLLSLIQQDLKAGYGLCVLDPHGDLTNDVLASVPLSREADVLLLDLQDTAYPFAFDLFAGIDARNPSSLASGADRVVSIFKKVWGESSWGPRLEDLLANAVHTLLSNPGTTLADLPTLLTDPTYRTRLVANVGNRIVRDYWEIEYNPLKDKGQGAIYAPLMNKVRAFLRDPVLSQIVSQSGTTIDFASVLARRQVLLVRLNLELPEATGLLGTAIVLRLLEAALKRKNLPESQRSPFLIYADEFQRFATPTFGTFLEEARKYAVGTILAHQRREQLSADLQSAVMGAVNKICFHVNSRDAREMARDFATLPPELPSGDLIEWGKYHGTDRTQRLTWDFLNTLRVLVVRREPWAAPLTAESVERLFAQQLRRVLYARDSHDAAFPVGYHYSIHEAQLRVFGDDEAARREETRRKLNEISARFGQLRDHWLADQQFDATTLVKLPKLQAASKLLLDDGMHQYRLQFSYALNRECSTTVRAMLDHDANRGKAPSSSLHPEYVAVGERARRIRQRNRRRYQQAPPQPVVKPQPLTDRRRPVRPTQPRHQPQPTQQVPLKAPVSPAFPQAPLPFAAEVDIDE